MIPIVTTTIRKDRTVRMPLSLNSPRIAKCPKCKCLFVLSASKAKREKRRTKLCLDCAKKQGNQKLRKKTVKILILGVFNK